MEITFVGQVGECGQVPFEMKKPVQDNLDLVIGEGGLHEFDAVNVWHTGNMVED